MATFTTRTASPQRVYHGVLSPCLQWDGALWGHGREPDGLVEILKVTVSVSMISHTVGELSQACPLATRLCLNHAGPSSCFIHSLNKAQASAAQIRECLVLSVFFPSIYASCNLCKLQFASFCMWLVFTADEDLHLGKCVIHKYVTCCVDALLYKYKYILIQIYIWELRWNGV